ncbi:hydrolase, alpha/beta fold family, putative [Amycolatopsis methanolica 239]|uniref:Hydrolase, alpha/beta fold family, putative n=1 Tax=Amycolatopsis methanolica 239 TaxID=1068978 RepID=A0A076N1Z0_AMYME|nr:hydrolase, alpha/beta fold family, putative [Amycolatopsis methanolica 239]
MAPRPVQVMFNSLGTSCAGDRYLPDAYDPVPGLVLGHSGVMVKEALAVFAPYFVRPGFAVLVIDYRTVGASEGDPRGQDYPQRDLLPAEPAGGGRGADRVVGGQRRGLGRGPGRGSRPAREVCRGAEPQRVERLAVPGAVARARRCAGAAGPAGPGLAAPLRGLGPVPGSRT